MSKRWNNAITDVPSIKVGHATHEEALTGCTVVLCEDGAVGGVDQRGGAPGTRETDSMKPMHLVQTAHAIVLAGGSAFGLEAATGVVRYLEERGIGFDVQVAKVPIVPAAILFDLGIGNPSVRPDAAMGYIACQAADDGLVTEGNVGAGTGATVGKIMGLKQAMKAGLGTASVDLGEGLIVGAIVAVNAFGDVIDPQTGQIIAGARSLDDTGFADTLTVMKSLVSKSIPSTALRRGPSTGSGRRSGQGSGHRLEFAGPRDTVIGVVATNARLNKEEANKVAQMAQDGLARAVRPAHTMFDGDTLFALATGSIEADVNTVGAYAAEVVAEAIVRAIKTAEGVVGLPAWRDLEEEGSSCL